MPPITSNTAALESAVEGVDMEAGVFLRLEVLKQAVHILYCTVCPFLFLPNLAVSLLHMAQFTVWLLMPPAGPVPCAFLYVLTADTDADWLASELRARTARSFASMRVIVSASDLLSISVVPRTSLDISGEASPASRTHLTMASVYMTLSLHFVHSWWKGHIWALPLRRATYALTDSPCPCSEQLCYAHCLSHLYDA